MSSDQMLAPGKTKLIKFPPSRAGKDVKCPGYARGGDVEASIWLIHNRNGEKITVSRKKAKKLTVNRKSHHPIETFLFTPREVVPQVATKTMSSKVSKGNARGQWLVDFDPLCRFLFFSESG